MKITSNHISKLFFLGIVLLPVFSGLLYAIFYSLGLIGILNDGFSTEVWRTIFTTEPFWKSLLFSIYIALTSVTIAIILALTIAISWRKSLQKGFLSYAIYLPLCFPATVMAFFSFQLLSRSGFLSRVAFNFDFIDSLNSFPEWINDGYGIGIIFTSVLLITPFFIILFSNLYQTENLRSFITLSKSFGASKQQTFLKVTLPILLKKASGTIYLFIIFVMGSYEVPLLLGRQDPQMISVAILQKIQRFNLYDIPTGYAMSVLYVLIITVALVFIYLKNITLFKTQKSDV
ncbi:sugar ABC transporter permease [Joostella atrarenae]|uniref:Sugar ABC transporter permease n=1 Tax=Joostella atrarenae TaxID=679257 RepID=A0ABS9J5L8_9FLAO|nr:ABC transporter permease subunit [Joostella atrarenae]MCF8715717.1 sugar ABC transporter permease [Joostella atrarenae]